jgi:hypothetical protein
MKTWVGIAVGLTALSWSSRFSGSAHACSIAAPGIASRSVWPGPEQAVPTNARIVVRYNMTGSPLNIPAFGQDLQLLDADGSQVSATMEVLGTAVVIRAGAGLLPNHAYQLADRRTIPCSGIGLDPCPLAADPQVFASFTTSAGVDTAPPAFGGLTNIGAASHLTCNSDACCGTYDYYVIQAGWAAASDDVAGGDVRYNLYRREGSSLILVSELAEGTSTSGTAVCSGTVGGLPFVRGDYVVRAVDWAGNEDSNLATRHLDDPCGSGAACAIGGSPLPPDRSPWLVAAAALSAAGVGIARRRARRRR